MINFNPYPFIDTKKMETGVIFLSKILILPCMIIHNILKKKHFCCYCLQASNTKEMLKRHTKDCFNINGKQRIIMLKKVNMLNLKITKAK